MEINVHALQKVDIDLLAAGFTNIDRNKTVQLFQRYYSQQEKGELLCLVATLADTDIGYLTICWNSRYDSFRKRAIPEIKDLYVLPHFRGKGYGTQLMDHAEKLISERSDYAGIGVGLYSDYGSAQRMYVLRGYIPDGLGLMYNDQKVESGSNVKVDDYLALMFTKKLKSEVNKNIEY